MVLRILPIMAQALGKSQFPKRLLLKRLKPRGTWLTCLLDRSDKQDLGKEETMLCPLALIQVVTSVTLGLI